MGYYGEPGGNGEADCGSESGSLKGSAPTVVALAILEISVRLKLE